MELKQGENKGCSHYMAKTWRYVHMKQRRRSVDDNSSLSRCRLQIVLLLKPVFITQMAKQAGKKQEGRSSVGNGIKALKLSP